MGEVESVKELQHLRAVLSETRAKLSAALGRESQLRAGLLDFAKYGTRHDLIPTRAYSVPPWTAEQVGLNEVWWLGYIGGMDNYLRDRALQILESASEGL